MILGQTRRTMTLLNQQQLYKRGEDRNRVALPPYYFQFYADMKLRLNPSGVTDLKLTGDFYNSMYISIDNEEITFDSNDWKTPKLERKYGKNIFGLTNESMAEYTRGTFWPLLKARIEAVTGLKVQ